MLRNLIIALILLGSKHVIAQKNYDTYYYFALMQGKQDNKAKALLYFDSAFMVTPEVREGLNRDYAKAGEYAAILGQYEKASIYIQNAIKLGVLPTSFESESFSNFWKSPSGLELQMDGDSLYKDYLSSINQEILDELDHMCYVDQLVRRGEVNSEDSSSLADQVMIYVDSLNIERLIEITEKVGFPTPKTVGYDGFSAVFLLLWHNRTKGFYESEQLQRLKPFIDKELEKGNIYAPFYTMFEDYYRFEKDKPSKYGSVLGLFRFYDDIYSKIEFEDPENLNVRRAEVGLCPIEVFVDSFGGNLPPSLKGVVFN